MKNRIIVESVSVGTHSLDISFRTEGDISAYFTDERIFRCEYSADISALPEAVAVVPFVCSVLPLVWLTDAELTAGSIDKDFHDCLPHVRRGYEDMYPMLQFRGRLKAGLCLTRVRHAQNCAALFSGGADAFCTMFAHLEERPAIITIWGADIATCDTEGWHNVSSRAQHTGRQYGLDNEFIKSNFRELLREDRLSALVSKSGDGYWHGFLHGIALLGLCAPIAFTGQLDTLYIASSFTTADKGKIKCASDPSIDNHVRFCGARVVHDGYELNRQQKIELICNAAESTGYTPEMHVCWQSSGGGNCCRCEKCLRTIYSLLACGRNPAHYGFGLWEQYIGSSRRTVLREATYTTLWNCISERLGQQPAESLPEGVLWLRGRDLRRLQQRYRRRPAALLSRLRHLVGSRIISPAVTAAMRLRRR
ncbi:MAG: hypothetical protein K2L27_00465 [Muribaculaceae bacterium]|nr:hypothetical protein [Muribaculaceae bacterium]